MPKLTDAEYVKKNGMICPHCKSGDVECTGTYDPESMSIGVTCNACGEQWYDCLTLTGWEPK